MDEVLKASRALVARFHETTAVHEEVAVLEQALAGVGTTDAGAQPASDTTVQPASDTTVQPATDTTTDPNTQLTTQTDNQGGNPDPSTQV